MAIGLFTAGTRITAALLNSIAPLSVIKPSDQSVTSSTTLVNDSALFLPVVASATYLFDAYLDFEGAAIGTGDLKIEWTVPAGAALRFDLHGLNTASSSFSSTFTDGVTTALGTTGAASLRGALMKGSLVMAATAGNLQLKWAQNTSSATATIVHAQSYVALWRVT